MTISDKKTKVRDKNSANNIYKDYVINVDLETMQYRTISENCVNECFDIPMIGKYDELVHRLSMNFIYADDLETFLNSFWGENIRKITDSGTSVLSEEIRIVYQDKIYWKNINAVIYYGENHKSVHAIISFFDITDRKNKKSNPENIYKKVSEVYDFVFTVSLTENSYLVIIQNDDFSCPSHYNSFKGFSEWFASRTESPKRKYIHDQLSIKNIADAFKSGKTELYFKFRMNDNNGVSRPMSMCISQSSDRNSAIVLCRFDRLSYETPVRNDIFADEKYSRFMSECFNAVYYENDVNKAMNKVMVAISHYFNAVFTTIFMFDDVFPSVIKPVYFYSAKGKKIRGSAMLTGADYMCELNSINDELGEYGICCNSDDDIKKKYPVIGNYMVLNEVKKSVISRIRFESEKFGFICLEMTDDFEFDENAVRIASVFVAAVLDKKFTANSQDKIKQIKKRHEGLLNLIYNRMQNGVVQFEVLPEKKNIRLLNFNKASCNILGCTSDMMKRMFVHNFYNVVADEDKALINNAVKQLISCEKQSTQSEVRLLNNKSDIKWVHVNMFRIDSANDKVIVIQAELTDITAVKQEQIEKELVYDSMFGGVVKYAVKDNSTEFISANRRFYEIFGKEKNNEIPYIFSDENHKKYISEHMKDMLERKEFGSSFCIYDKSGSKKWISVSSKCIGTKSGYPLYVSVIFDITEREEAYISLEKANMELKIRTERYRLIEKSNDENIVEYDVLSDKLIIQEKFENSDGGLSEIPNFIGDGENGAFRKYIHENDAEAYLEIMKKLMASAENGIVDYRASLYSKNDEYLWYRSYYTSVADKNGKVIKIISRIKNIENEKSKQKKLELQIKSDPMTGLLNKIASKSDISDELLNNSKVSALMIVDIDNFKSVNDNLGHMFGDAVLKNIASAICRTFRSTDIVGRIGGDEFIVFMKNTSSVNAEMKAQELCNSIKRSYVGNDKSIDVSCSIGISYSGIDGDDYDTLFEKADTAMYFSKKSGKNRFTSYSAHMKKNDHEITREDCSSVHDVKDTRFDMELISFALGLMSNSKNIDSSVNILLEQIGNKLDISDIFLFEADSMGMLTVSNSWSERNCEAVNITGLEIFESDEFDERGVLYVDDCQECDKCRNRGFKSVVIVRFNENSVINGVMVFGDRKNVRKWNEVQKNTLYELARLISVFTALRNERLKDKEKIALLKTTDALTGLYNFESFKLKAADIIAECGKNKSCALFYMDINGFAYVNDNFGYSAGDRMLCAFAENITGVLKSGMQGCACRVYSDYFMLLLAGNSRSELMTQLKSANDYFFETQRKAYPAGSIGLSTGIYFIGDEHGDNITVAIDNADLARQKAKRTNQNTYEIYSSDLRRSRSNELSIIGELYRAMEKGRIELFLQPKFKLDTREVIGAEALARWRNDDSTLKYPSEFVPALEKIGYIVKLDFYMYEQVLKCMKKWIGMGIKPIPISVNFSRKNSLEDGFYEHVYDLAAAYGIDSSLIEIETTESTFISDLNKMIENLRRFRNAGFKIDIDDFGTGYSSLNMLVSAPVDIVKIDKSFLKNIDDSQSEREYVKQMCRMISTARKDIIFEGVETENQAKFLLDCGFTMAQGYLFDKPIPLEEFENKYIFNK